MEINLSTGTYLHFYLVSAADGRTPMPSVPVGSMAAFYAGGGDMALVPYPLNAGLVQNLGAGEYRIYFPDEAFESVGPIVSVLQATACDQAIREDVVVLGAATWIGARLTVQISGQFGGSGMTGGDPMTDIDLPLADVHVQIRDSSGGFALWQGLTGANGQAFTMLSPGTYQVYAWRTGYIMDQYPATVVVGGVDQSISITATPFTPANPGGPDVTTVFGWLLDAAGAARVGVTISFELILPEDSGLTDTDQLRPFSSISTDKILSRVAVTDVTDSAGAFSVAITPNDDVAPAGSKYLVTFSDSPADRVLITAPTTPSSVNIESLL